VELVQGILNERSKTVLECDQNKHSEFRKYLTDLYRGPKCDQNPQV